MSNRQKRIRFTTLSIFILSLLLVSCSKKKGRDLKGKVIVFHAGSLSVPFSEIARGFEAVNPDVKIQLEAAGSRTCARKISELGRECDIMASADYSVIDSLLIPEFSSWNIKFAANEMVIAFTDQSTKSGIINEDNWYNLLLDDELSFGRSDPNSDPCGYRTVLVLKLAEKFYKRNGLTREFLSKDNEYVRGKETDLLALLETGAIDYMFIYRSVAKQHKLKFITLPKEINLKDAEFSEYYASAEVKISGKAPGKFITKHGAPMIYGVTIPRNAPSPRLAMRFIEYLLDKSKGGAILSRHGQPSVIPAPAEHYEKIPNRLRKFVFPVKK